MKMSFRSSLIFISIAIALTFFVSCGRANLNKEDSPAGSVDKGNTVNSQPKGSSEVLPPEIKTDIGTFILNKVEFTDKFDQYQADPGYQFTMVYFECPKSLSDGDIFRTMLDAKAYLTYEDETRIDQALTVISMADSKSGDVLYILTYTTKTSEKYYNFIWPGNDPIRIDNENLNK